MPQLSIIIPAYNEAPTIREIVSRVLKVPFPVDFEVIIVDDCSSDQTGEMIAMMQKEDASGRLKILRNTVNGGKGKSIQNGLAIASGNFAVVQDADFEYDPEELPRLLDPLLKGACKAVYGSRFLGARRPEGMAFPNYVANVFLTWLTNVLYGCRLTDMETCYKLVRMDLLRSLRLNADRFDFEPEITTKLVRKGVSILEMPIRYTGRTASEGKKIKARDFFIAIRVLFRNLHAS